MAIKLPNLEKLPSGPHRDFVNALHELYDAAGRPPSRAISRHTYAREQSEGDTVSHETVSAALRGENPPAWAKVKSIVTALAAMSVREQDVEERLRQLHQLWIKAQSGGRAREPADRPVLPLPDRNPHFTGRETLLHEMHQLLIEAPHVPLLLSGAPGAGKTQLALEYAHRHAERYSVVWWMRADQPGQAGAALARLAPSRGRCLLIYDNAEDEDIRGFLATIGGDVIVTSRNPGWGGHTGLEVADFGHADAIQLLCRRDSEMTGDLADEIIRRFGRRPLVLDQLTTVRSVTGQPWTDLLAQPDDQQ